MEPTLIDLMRHGEPVGGRRYRGQVDDPLSEVGWEQMWQAVADARPWQHVVTSPLVRCAAFADALGEKLGVAVTRDARLMECGFGAWEGRTPEEICADDPMRLFHFRSDPLAHAPAGAEPLAVFYARVNAAWHDLALRHRQDARVLVVAHAGVIRMILANVLGMPPAHAYRLGISNAALTHVRLEWDDDNLLPTWMI